MKGLIYYELKKLLSKKKILLTIATILAFCIVVFTWLTFTAFRAEQEEVLIFYSGAAWTGELAEAQEEYEALLNKMESGEELTEEESARFDALEDPVWLNNCDSVRKSILSELGIGVDTLIIGDTMTYGNIESFIADYFPILICFLIAFLLAPIFAQEYETGVDAILLATKNGKSKIIKAKVMAAGILTTLLFCVTLAIFFVMAFVRWGVDDVKASFVFCGLDPFNYLSSPFDFTCAQYLILMVIVSWVGCLGLAAFTLLLSAILRRSIHVVMGVLTVAYVPLFLCVMIGNEYSPIVNAMRLTYARIISVRTLFCKYSTLIGNVQTMYVSLIFVVATTVLFVILAGRCFRNHQVEN